MTLKRQQGDRSLLPNGRRTLYARRAVGSATPRLGSHLALAAVVPQTHNALLTFSARSGASPYRTSFLICFFPPHAGC
jgi:hypothetical protein